MFRYVKSNYDALNEAKDIISEYLWDEFGEDSEPDFNDLSNIGLAYTILDGSDVLDDINSDETHFEIQVSVDLIHPAVITKINNVVVSKLQYNSIRDLIENELKWLDFDSLVMISDDEWRTYFSSK